MGSTRFPGKPMYPLLGIPMIGHCYFRTCLVDALSDTYVATCDQLIFDYIESIGGKVVMTSTKHNRATERTVEALEIIEVRNGIKVDVVVMVQGDEPLIPPSAIAESINHFENKEVNIVNIISRFLNREQFEDKNNVKVVVNLKNDALYYSREPIPSVWRGVNQVPMYNQTGVIAFRRSSLYKFSKMTETPLEKIESVDMNRILEHDGKIRMVLADGYTLGVDTLEEAEKAAELLKEDISYKTYKNLCEIPKTSI